MQTMKSHTIVLAALLVAGCYNPTFRNELACGPGNSCPDGTSCGADGKCHAGGGELPDASVAPDAPPDASPACQASTVVCDSRGHIVTCGGNGTVVSDVACPLGCATSGATCARQKVSNGLDHFLTDAAQGADMVFPAGTTTITASTGRVVINNADVSVASEVFNGIRVFAFHSLKVNGQVQFAQEFPTPPAIAFVVDGKVEITRTLDVSGNHRFVGPGGLDGQASDNAGCRGGRGGHDNLLASKKGGGGGAGGFHAGAGAAVFDTSLVPLRGGCSGGQSGSGFDGGGGGGAIQIVSATSIELTDLGTIDASGGGGDGTPQQSGSDGSGGGGGGAILLEAPAISFRGASVVVSTKGAGGGGTGQNVNGTPVAIGEDGGTAEAPALGGFQVVPGTFLHGGNGGTVTVPPTVGPGSASDVGAGGGGSVGQARFNTRNGTVTVADGAAIRTPFAVGTLALQP
jgi:hypothetical protein